METNTPHWSFLEKLLFRFIFLLLILFILLYNNSTFPLINLILKYPLTLIEIVIPWLAKNFLNIPDEINVLTNGSGDTTYSYLLLLFITTVSIIGTLLWTLIDRKRINYTRLYYWLTVAVRFYVGIMLINYGMGKIIKVQFPSPNTFRLMQTYGESSPMGLAWTFLGFSKGYNLFMGIAELMAVFLLFRRTVMIGAIICLMTTANIMAINYFYNVPVKILSTALFTLCLTDSEFRHTVQLFL